MDGRRKYGEQTYESYVRTAKLPKDALSAAAGERQILNVGTTVTKIVHLMRDLKFVVRRVGRGRDVNSRPLCSDGCSGRGLRFHLTSVRNSDSPQERRMTRSAKVEEKEFPPLAAAAAAADPDAAEQNRAEPQIQ